MVSLVLSEFRGRVSPRRARHFSLLRQRKVPKRKATRSLGPCAALRATCAARFRRGSAELAFGSNNCGPDPASICAARPSQDGWGRNANSDSGARPPLPLGEGWGEGCLHGHGGVLGWLTAPILAFPREGKGQVRIRPQPPSVCAEERRFRRIRDRDCLRRSRVRARPRMDRAPQVELLGSDTHGTTLSAQRKRWWADYTARC